MQDASETTLDSQAEATAVAAVMPARLRPLVARLLLAACLLIALGDGIFLRHCFSTQGERAVAATLPPAAAPPATQAAQQPVEDPAIKIERDLAGGRPTILDLALIGEETDRLALMRRAGVDLEKLLRRLDPVTSDEGGPYVNAASMRTTPFDHTRLAELQRLFKTMPFAAPLAVLKVDSGFGMRRDPFNGNMAFHTGIDLGGPYRSAVYSTAPGRIVFAGMRDAYGRTVDIDHGNGIVTRYAHLARILVVRGQRVEAHQKIAELGSTGRSTGPHLHYEVIVDGKPQNPIRFLPTGADSARLASFSGE